MKPIVVSIDRPSCNRSHRGAAAEVADDEPTRRHPFGGPGDREAVEAEAADAAVAVALWQRVGTSDFRDRSVERRVEDRDMNGFRKQLARLGDRRERGRVVQRRELDERCKLGRNGVVDQRRLCEPFAAVDDAMADGGDLGSVFDRGDRPRLVVAVDDAQLEARRAGVDDQDIWS